MPDSRLVALLFEAVSDLDRALEGIDPQEAVRERPEGSSLAWTYAHTTNQVDAWVNVRFAGLEAHPLLGQQRFRAGGTGSAPEDWATIQQAVNEVRKPAAEYLTPLSNDDLEKRIPYDGSFEELRARGISLRYALMRAIAHHYFHTGEIATKRSLLGHEVGDFPGLLLRAL